MARRPDFSRKLPRPLVIYDGRKPLMRLTKLMDVRKLIGRLPADRKGFVTWQYVKEQLNHAARGADPIDVCIAVRMVLMMERIDCRPE
jgi:hypothetical protein